jgi:hypothetical protein
LGIIEYPFLSPSFAIMYAWGEGFPSAYRKRISVASLVLAIEC